MKIFYIANARMPTEKAHGIQIAKMCEAFVAQGVDLELIVPRRGRVKDTLELFYGLRHKIPLKYLPVINTYRFGKLGFFIGSVSFMNICFFYLLWQKIRGVRGIIYTVDMDHFSFLFIPLLGFPYFTEAHNAKPKDSFHSFFFRRAKGIIAINTIIKNKIYSAFSLPESRIIVCPNGIDLDMFSQDIDKSEARRRLGIPLDRRIVLYSGGFFGWKGLGVLADAADKLRHDALIYCVGGTKEKYEKVTGKKITVDNIIFAGPRDYKDMPLWLSAADVLMVLGTKKNDYSYYHTSPMKIFEYMASRRPIVASRTPANREIVSDNEVTFYEPDNADSLASKLNYALDNLQGLRDKIESALRKAREYSWEKRAKSILLFIREKHE